MQNESGEVRRTAALPPIDADEDAILAMLAGIEDGALRVVEADAAKLGALLLHPDKGLRRRASGALASAVARGEIAAATCHALLASDDPAQRWGAAFALGRAGQRTTRVVDVALATLEDSDGDVRWAASSIVMAEARVSEDLRATLRGLVKDGPPTTRKMALMCLGDHGERELPTFLAALADTDAMVRLAALTTIGRSGDCTSSTREAVAAVADHDVEASVRRAAVAVLRRLQQSSATGSNP